MMGYWQFTIPGRLPGLTEMIEAAKGHGGHGYGYSKLKKKWTNDIALIIKGARIPKLERIWVDYYWYEPVATKREHPRDPDNVSGGGRKIINDSLKLAHVIPNDTMKEIAGWQDNFEADDTPRIVVTVWKALEAYDG